MVQQAKRISQLTESTAPAEQVQIPVIVGNEDYETRRVTLATLLGGVRDLRVSGAVADSAASAALNTAAIQGLITALNALGGGEIYIPPGTWHLAEGSALATVCVQLGSVSNIRIRGAGEGITTLKLKDSGASHVINIDGATNIKISDLTIDGNRANNTGTSWHGIRTGSSGVTGLTIERVTVQNTRGYGLGLQAGNKKRLRAINVTVQDTGLDACDFKNTSDDSEDIYFAGYSARRWGLDGSVTEQAGIDCRGPCQLFGVWCSEGPTDGHYIRFREGEVADSSLGAHYSTLHGFVVEGNSGASSIGVYIAAHDVHISGGRVSDTLLGVNLQGVRVSVSGVSVESCDDESFQVNVGAEDASLSDCKSISATGSGYRIRAPRTTMNGCHSLTDAVAGISTESTALGFNCLGFQCKGPGGVSSVGVSIASADAALSGGYITVCNRGVVTSGAGTKLVGVVATANVDDGFLFAVGSDDSLMSGCTASSNTDDGVTVRSDRVVIRDCLITGNTQNGVAIESGGDNTRISGTRFASNGGALDDAGAGTLIYADNDGLGGRVARTVDESVASTATSANIDIPILAAKTYLFRLKAVAEDSNGDRACKVVLIETLRSASASPTTPTQGAFFVSGDGANLTVNNTISGNNLRLSVTNGMGHNCRLTTVVEELYRDTTAEYS